MALKNNKIHRELDREELIRTFGYALILAIFFCMVLFYIYQCVIKVRIENEVDDLICARTELIQMNYRLRLERGYLRSLNRIDQVARERLGFRNPEAEQMIMLGSEKEILGDMHEQ